MPYFVEKRTTRTRPEARISADEIDSTRRVALGLIDDMITVLTHRLATVTDRRDRQANRAIKHLRDLFADRTGGTELPERDALGAALETVFDLVPAARSDAYQPGFAEAALSYLEQFVDHSRGGYTPEMLVIVMADLYRQYSMLDASHTVLWFVATMRPDQLWVKPPRGFPRQMLTTDAAGREYSPAALHWVHNCYATAQGL